MATGLHHLPPEVVHQVFGYLVPKDAAAFRMQAVRYAAIGREYLETRLRFFTEKNSLERLAFFSSTPDLCKRIKTIVYEGNLLGERCKHDYFNHFRLEHHAGDCPQKPAPGASERALRLYQRNLAQWESNKGREFQHYRDLLDEQKTLVTSEQFRQALNLVSTFINLEHVQLSTETRCGHHLSQRFLEKYPLSW
jgi:hypothetical protein